MKKLLFLTTVLISTLTFAQTPTLVKDITPSNISSNFGSNGSNPSGVVVNNTLFAIINFGLWKSDGTESGSTLLKSFNYPSELVGISKAGNVVYFTEYLSSTNVRLWKSDGTVAGTVVVANVSGGIINSIQMNGILYFVCSNSSSITELWRSDGTETGTYMVKNTNQYGWNFNKLEVIGNTLFFVVNSPSTGFELWKSDGTIANTQIVKDIFVGNESSNPQNLLAVNGILYFSAQNASYDYELWRSDGTETGTYLVKNINPYYSSNPSNFQTVNNLLVFSAYDVTHGGEIWVSDGTTTNTFLLKDIYPGSQTGYQQGYIAQLSSINGAALFMANDGINGLSLWKTDGTANGTFMVKDLVPGNNDNFNIFNIFTYQTLNQVYFSVVNDSNYDDLWQSDGTTNGTFKVNSLNNNVVFYLKNSSIMVNNTTGNNFFFPAYDKEAGIELWKTDGTPSGLLRVKDISTGGSQSSNIKKLSSINGYTFFSANNIINGNELWRTDGTTTNTELFRDFTIGFNNSGNTEFGFMTLFKNQLYIQTNIGNIWRTDGTQFSLFKSFPGSGALGSYPSIAIGDNMFFVNTDNLNDHYYGYELFKTDGVNTSLVKDINTGNFADSFPEKFCDVNGTLFFTANDGINGRELWKSDGTESGTVLIKNISSGANSTNFNEMISANGLVFFMTDNYSKLWRSDGTESGTYQLYDAGNYMGSMFSFNNKIYFAGFETAYDGELWESDGTSTGTKLTKNISPAYGSFPFGFVELNGTMYFNANSQFWKSDGTSNGTVLVSSAVSPYNLYNANGVLYFSAYSNNNGTELWQSDGTIAGTSLVADLNAGGNSSNPNNFHLSDTGKLFFLAENNTTTGIELFVRLSCIQNFTLASSDNYPNGTTIKKEANISINATNKVESGANVKYDAGKYINLNAGFEAKEGSIFKAYIDGCNNDEPNLAASKKQIFNVDNVKDLTKNYPTFNDFINLPENTTLRTAYSIAKGEKELFEKNKLLIQNTPTQKPISEPTSISYYITETGQKDAVANYKLVLKIGDKEYSNTLQKKL